MNYISSYKILIKFSKQTKDINPNLYNDIKKRTINPSKGLLDYIKKHNVTKIGGCDDK